MSGSISPEESSRQVQQRENEWADAILRKDQAALEKILASDFVLRTAAGNYSRAEWFTATVEGMDPKALQVHDPKVSIFGDVAVVQCLLYWHVIRSEKMPPDPRKGGTT